MADLVEGLVFVARELREKRIGLLGSERGPVVDKGAVWVGRRVANNPLPLTCGRLCGPRSCSRGTFPKTFDRAPHD